MSTDIARPDFYRRIDSSLHHKEVVLDWIDAIRMEAPRVVQSTSLGRLRERLERAQSAEDVCSDPILAAWLPAIMSGAPEKEDSSSETLPKRSSRSWDPFLQLLRIEVLGTRNSVQTYLYPLVLLAIVTLMFGLLLIFIVPSFDQMFREFQLRLPTMTRIIFGMSNLLIRHPLGSLSFLFLLFALYVIVWRILSLAFPWMQKSWLLGSLSAGNAANVVAMSRMVGTIATAMESGATVPQALRIGGLASQRIHLRDRACQLAREIETANQAPMHSEVSHNLPPLLTHALGLGDQGNVNTELLQQLAILYADRSGTRLTWSTSFINPIAILLIGFLIGMVVISLFMPLISLVTALS